METGKAGFKMCKFELRVSLLIHILAPFGVFNLISAL
jgi:hypothetical protein